MHSLIDGDEMHHMDTVQRPKCTVYTLYIRDGTIVLTAQIDATSPDM